jgi:hypothetical protein
MSDGGQALLEELRVVAGDLLGDAALASTKTSIAAGGACDSPDREVRSLSGGQQLEAGFRQLPAVGT